MSFFTFPLLLGGIAATVIPILLHLIMRGVPKKIIFPPLRFLKNKRKVNQRKFRLRHLLLLLFRVGIFVLLGFALARPSIRFEWNGKSAASSLITQLGSQAAPIAAAIVIDTSPKMELQIANNTRLELAKSEARWLLSQFPQQSQVAILSSTRMSDSFQVDLFSAVERIEHLSVIPDGRTLGQSVAEAVRLLQSSELETKEMYIFTDLTQSAWPKETAQSVKSQLGENIGVYVVDIGVEIPNNTGVSKLNLSGQVLSTQSSFQLDAEISHFGKKTERVLELITLDAESNEQRRASEILELPEGTAIQNISFSLANLSQGIHQGMLRMTTSDSLPVDDRFYFTVEVQPAWKILIVASEPVERNALYYQYAIDLPEFRKRGGSSFQTEAISWRQFMALSDSKWDAYRAIVFLDPGPVSQTIWKMLADYASTGHGVGMFLGRNVTPALVDFQTESAMELLGGKPLRQARTKDEIYFAPTDFQSPVVADFRQIGEVSLVPWETQPIFRYWEMSDLVQSAHIELRYSDGRPAIISKQIGRGIAITMSTPVSDSPNSEPWNLVPVGENSWVFLGLADGISRLLVGAGEQAYNYYPAQTATLNFQDGTVPTNCILTLPDGNTAKPSTDTVKRQVRVGATDQIGNYRLRSTSARKYDGGFSVNYAPGQLDLTRIEPGTLDQYFGEKKYRIAKDRSEIEIVVARGRTGQELFPLLIICICALFVGEYLFSNRFYR